jgi:histidine ammonia-lyase/3-hydroxyacyl-CoA dehydrogenase
MIPPPLSGPALVIGGGTMAVGIAARLVAAGIDTTVLVRREEAVAPARAQIIRRMARLREYRLVTDHAGPGARLAVRHEQTDGSFALVVESVAEDLEAKRVVLARAEAMVASGGIVTTNTSSLRLSDISAHLSHPARFAGWHWFNPAELVPLVEIVGTPRTDPATLRRLAELSTAIGKQPITARRDVPGFVANRLQYALLREAYALVETGVCEVADVDRAVVSGLGARWAAIGPFAAMDAAGLDVHAAVAAQLFPQLSAGTDVPALLRRARERGATGVKGGSGLCGDYPPEAADRLVAHRDDILALLSVNSPDSGSSADSQDNEVSTNGPLILGDRPLRYGDVVAVAAGRPVVLGADARGRMKASRVCLEELLARGDAVYGLTTGVGAMKTVRIPSGRQEAFQTLLLRAHRVGSGSLAAPRFVRAAMLVRAAGLAVGVAGVRPEVADALCRALDAPVTPRVHQIGSIGQADLSQLAEIGLALIGFGDDGAALVAAGYQPIALGPREAHAIVNSNAFSVGVASLALDLATRALRALDLSAALSIEALIGNVDALHPAVAQVRPHPGITATVDRLRALLCDGALLTGARPARAIQDPLAFKVVPQTHGGALQALSHLGEALDVELASSGDSPMVIADEGRAISTGNHDITPVAIAIDYARLGLAQAITIAGERVSKLLDSAFTGLPTGLRADPLMPEDGLAIIANGAASVAAEARLLAHPVTLEQPTSGIAAGIEDRITMAPAGARRLYEMATLALRLAAMELTCGAQAVDLRGTASELGDGTARAYAATRRSVAFTVAGEACDGELDQLEEWLASDAVP